MNKHLSAAVIAAALVITGAYGGTAFAQTPPAVDAAKQTPPATAPAAAAADDAKAKAAEDREAKRKAKREERKAKREAAKKERGEKRRSRLKECGAEWREAKTAGKIEKGMTWPKFWSACNTRLKAQAEQPKAN
jgi:hypothetical protein